MIRLKGSKKSWGFIAKIFHWLMAFLILMQISFGINLHFIINSEAKDNLIHFHKVFGTFILCLIFLRLIWRFYNTKPLHKEVSFFHRLTSTLVHILLYALVFIIPIQGMIITWLGGSDVLMFGFIKLPRLIEENFILYDTFVSYHFFMTIVLLSLFFLHLIGAFYHYIKSNKNNVWRSMSLTDY